MRYTNCRLDLEDIKLSIENEKNRLQNQIRDLEKEQLQAEHKAQSIYEELQRAQASNTQQQAEEKELQARLLNEVEERERAHQEIHQLKKQVSEQSQNNVGSLFFNFLITSSNFRKKHCLVFN